MILFLISVGTLLSFFYKGDIFPGLLCRELLPFARVVTIIIIEQAVRILTTSCTHHKLLQKSKEDLL